MLGCQHGCNLSYLWIIWLYLLIQLLLQTYHFFIQYAFRSATTRL